MPQKISKLVFTLFSEEYHLNENSKSALLPSVKFRMAFESVPCEYYVCLTLHTNTFTKATKDDLGGYSSKIYFKYFFQCLRKI